MYRAWLGAVRHVCPDHHLAEWFASTLWTFDQIAAKRGRVPYITHTKLASMRDGRKPDEGAKHRNTTRYMFRKLVGAGLVKVWDHRVIGDAMIAPLVARGGLPAVGYKYRGHVTPFKIRYAEVREAADRYRPMTTRRTTAGEEWARQRGIRKAAEVTEAKVAAMDPTERHRYRVRSGAIKAGRASLTYQQSKAIADGQREQLKAEIARLRKAGLVS